MTVGLVANIPHDLIIWGIKDIVKGYGKLRNAKTGTKMASVDGYIINDKLSEFLAELH